MVFSPCLSDFAVLVLGPPKHIMGKKRKFELDLDVERNMYSSFVTAANAVSQLYTQGVQQQRRAAAAASRATLVSCAVLAVLAAVLLARD